MGTPSLKKFLKHLNGAFAEEAAISTTLGASDADKIPATNAAGVLDPTLLNAKIVSAGAADSGKMAQLDASGRLDTSVMPNGIGADTKIVIASEALSAGDLVNIYNNAGTANVRKADGSTSGKSANGYVTAAVSNGANALVYFENTNAQMSGMTPGTQYLSVVTPGKSSPTPPSGSGNVVQIVGFATSATEMNFQFNQPIILA